MNNQEKKALFRFVTIYTFSSIVLVAIIAYLYYEKELDRQKNICKRDLENCVMKVESDLLKAKLQHKTFQFKQHEYTLGVGLFDKNGEKLESSLSYENVNLQEKMVKDSHFIHFVQKLQTPLFNIYYIVAEDTSMPIGKEKLITLIMVVIFFSFIFIAFIGYLLSRLLLKPVREKIAHIDRFIKDSAHEINTPIASLLMSVSALKKKGIMDSKILNHISISSKQISDIYNSLSHLAFDEIESEKISSKVDFKELVLKSVEFYSEIAKAKQITIQTDLKELTVMIDKNDAKKLINNLLSNAVKYSKIKKVITVTIKDATLGVKDEGIGIDQKEKKAILKRYHRGTDMHGGFGIGLDIVNSICHRYGIRLNIDSKKYEGSLFSLDLTPIIVSA